jgi:hypothetical protein
VSGRQFSVRTELSLSVQVLVMRHDG